jgi:hypothetical protein
MIIFFLFVVLLSTNREIFIDIIVFQVVSFGDVLMKLLSPLNEFSVVVIIVIIFSILTIVSIVIGILFFETIVLSIDIFRFF